MGARNKKDFTSEDTVRALHIKCDKEFFHIVKVILSEAYATMAKVFPGNMKMRLVPDISSIPNPKTQHKVLHLCAKQAAFLSMVKDMTSYEIASFDHPFVDKNGEKATI